MKQTRPLALSRASLSLHPFFRDLGLTGVTQFVTLVAGLAVVSLFGRLLGAAALGEYLLLRRVAAWFLAGVEVCAPVALPRYVALTAGESEGKAEGYLLAALAYALIAISLSGVLLNAGAPWLARWLFGGQQMAYLMLPLTLFVAGTMMETPVFGYFQGYFLMARANALQLFGLVATPILVVLALHRFHSTALIVNVMGVCLTVGALAFALPVLVRIREREQWHILERFSELVRFGITRIPGSFGLGALMALAPILAAHLVPLSQVAYLLLGGTLLAGVAACTAPLGVVLLSKVSTMVAQSRDAEIRARLEHMLAAILELSAFGCLQLLVFADVLVSVWVGPGFLEGITVIRIILLATPFYVFYAALRNVIDAGSITAHNSRNIAIALAVFLAGNWAATKVIPKGFALEGVAGSWTLGLIVLACLSARSIRTVFNVALPWRRSAYPILLGVLLGAASFVIDRQVSPRIGVVGLVAVESVMCAVFLGLLWKVKSGWLPFVWNFAFAPPCRVMK